MQRHLPLFSAFALAHLMAIFVTACGSGVASQISASITPTQATVATGSTVEFRGDATGPSGLWTFWWVQESSDLHPDDPSKYCWFLTVQDASFTNCPFGYVVIGSEDTIPSYATYFAPPTPGTYHVTFQAWFEARNALASGGKTATATVTVTP